jgi:hypothetical protein
MVELGLLPVAGGGVVAERGVTMVGAGGGRRRRYHDPPNKSHLPISIWTELGWFFLFLATMVVEKRRRSSSATWLTDRRTGTLEQVFFPERNTRRPSLSP